MSVNYPIVRSSALLKNGYFAIGPAGMSISNLETGNVFFRSTDQTLQCVHTTHWTAGSPSKAFALDNTTKQYLTNRYAYMVVVQDASGLKSQLENVWTEREEIIFEEYDLSEYLTSGSMGVFGYAFSNGVTLDSAYYSGQNHIVTGKPYVKLSIYFFNMVGTGFILSPIPDNLAGQVRLDKNNFIVGGVNYNTRKVVSVCSSNANQVARSLNHIDEVIPVDGTINSAYVTSANTNCLQILGTSGGGGWEFDIPNGIIKKGGGAWWHSGFGRNRCTIRQTVNLTFPIGEATIHTDTPLPANGSNIERSYSGEADVMLQGSPNTLLQIPLGFSDYPEDAVYMVTVTPTARTSIVDVEKDYYSEVKPCVAWFSLTPGAKHLIYRYSRKDLRTIMLSDFNHWLIIKNQEVSTSLYIVRYGNQLRARMHIDVWESYKTLPTWYYTWSIKELTPQFKITVTQIV